MNSFRKFIESKFFGTLEKQLKIPKKLWEGMPLLVNHAVIGNIHIVKPTMFYVSEFNRDYVTIKSFKDEPITPDEMDDEVDLSTDNDPIEATISRKDFEKLSEFDSVPQNPMGSMGGMSL